MPADKVKEETEEEMPDARVEVKEEKPDSLARERAVGSGETIHRDYMHRKTFSQNECYSLKNLQSQTLLL